MFGGVKTDPSLRDNNLYLLTIGERKHKWEIVETSGMQPEACYKNRMHFLESAQTLVLIGGKRFKKP